MSNGGVPNWLKAWLVILTIVVVWFVVWAWRASNWSKQAVMSIEDRVDAFATVFENHTHTVVVDGQTLTTSPAGPITWPVDPWPPETLKFP